MRIFPDRWASITCPFFNSTRNIVLGSDSLTTPSTSIASSTGIITKSDSKTNTKTTTSFGKKSSDKKSSKKDRWSDTNYGEDGKFYTDD